jgi:RNA polymerase sigma-70 factor (ECF subfamily)
VAAFDPRRSEPSSESTALGRAEAEAVLAAVDRLPERDRLVIAYRFLLELTEAETAEALGVPPGTVKSRLSRGLQRLRAQLNAGVVEVEQA